MKKLQKTILLAPIILLALSVCSFSSASEITGELSNQGVIRVILVAPSGVTVAKTGDREITISWNDVGGVDGYKIYRKKDSNDFQLLADNITALLYKDLGLVDGIYSYQVQSFKGNLMPNLNDIPPTEPITIVTQAPVTPASPASSGGGGGGGGGGSYTPPPAVIKGDFNGNGKVDKYDFSLMMANWGKTGTNNCDLNNDGKVDKYDFALLMSNWTI